MILLKQLLSEKENNPDVCPLLKPLLRPHAGMPCLCRLPSTNIQLHFLSTAPGLITKSYTSHGIPLIGGTSQLPETSGYKSPPGNLRLIPLPLLPYLYSLYPRHHWHVWQACSIEVDRKKSVGVCETKAAVFDLFLSGGNQFVLKS